MFKEDQQEKDLPLFSIGALTYPRPEFRVLIERLPRLYDLVLLVDVFYKQPSLPQFYVLAFYHLFKLLPMASCIIVVFVRSLAGPE